MGAMKLSHVAVKTTSLEASEAFYSGLLGLPLQKRWADEAGAPRSVWLTLEGDAFLALERAHDTSPTRADDAPGLHCLALTILRDERETWREKLCSAGLPVERETPFSLYTRDPDGNLVALSHYPFAVE